MDLLDQNHLNNRSADIPAYMPLDVPSDILFLVFPLTHLPRNLLNWSMVICMTKNLPTGMTILQMVTLCPILVTFMTIYDRAIPTKKADVITLTSCWHVLACGNSLPGLEKFNVPLAGIAGLGSIAPGVY